VSDAGQQQLGGLQEGGQFRAGEPVEVRPALRALPDLEPGAIRELRDPDAPDEEED